jgi:hypothetical protein
VISEDVLTILKLQKEKVAAQLAQDEGLDVVALLTRLAGRELPGNVARELAEWSEHSEKFVLYRGFALFEGDEDLAAAAPFTVERISPHIRIVHSPDALFARLEQAELVPLRMEHTAAALRPLSQKARTVFARERRKRAKAKVKVKQPVTLKRHTIITLHFPGSEALEKLRQALLEIRCPVEVDKDNLTVTFSKRYEPQVTQVIEALQKDYRIHIEDLE